MRKTGSEARRENIAAREIVEMLSLTADGLAWFLTQTV